MASEITITMAARLAVLTPISMLPSTIGPIGIAGTCAMCQSQCVVETVGKEHAEKLAESYADCGDGARLDHEKERPAIEKTPERPKRLAQVNILAAGFGHHGGEFAIAQRADDRHEGGDHPCSHKERRRVGAARDISVDKENAGTNHGSRDDRRRAEQTKALDQPC